MNSKATIFIEYLWLVIAVGSLSAGLHQWYNSSLENSLLFFAMVFIALLMYTFRRHLRRQQNNKKE